MFKIENAKIFTKSEESSYFKKEPNREQKSCDIEESQKEKLIHNNNLKKNPKKVNK